MELVGSIIEIVKFIGTPICKNLKYHRNLAEDLKTLEGILEELNCQKEDMECTLREELRFGKIPKKEVEDWLQKVEGVDNEIRRLVEEKAIEGKCFSRAILGKKVEKKSKEVKELSEKGRSFNSLVVDASTRGVTLSTTTLVGETTAFNEIWNYLIGDEVRKIGVFGMGGVGKTTIMKHVNNNLLKETDKFNYVIWVTVSQQFDLGKLQDDIATALKENFSKEKDTTKRAGMLLTMLEGRKRYVLILDDTWEKIPLEAVGIPEPTRESGCKLVITTRSTKVCHSMGCEAIEVKPLSKEEASKLFLDTMGRGVLQFPTLKENVNLIVEECAGLPLAIVTIASSMTGVNDVREWNNALYDLREHINSLEGMDQVFGRLQFSYDRLKDRKVQYCFLYCALYSEDFKIPRNELIEYWIDEGLIEERGTRLAMYDRGHAILNRLENNCLLERVGDGGYVKMHDLIRDMALRITSVSPRFMVKAGMQLEELPSEHEWRDVEKMSLMRNFITEIPPDMPPECQTLSTLLLQRNRYLTMIHESFFAKMVRLEILDLSYTDIEDLPASIFDLKNLTALLLEGCRNLRHVPDLISKLQALKKLVLRGTGITKVPRGMAKLKNLRYLDLRTATLKEMPAGLLTELSRLQHLILYVESKTLKVKGEELAQLRKLERFEGQLYGVHDIHVYVKSLPGQKGPNHYSIHVGSTVGEASKSKYVSIKGVSISGGSFVLPTNIQQLNIARCHDVRSVSDISSLKDATDLRRCLIWGCEGMECVFSLSSSFSYCTTPLQSLEEIELYDLENLRVLIKGGEAAAVSASPPPPATFSHLRILKVIRCPKIKKLFWPGLLRDLQNLEEITVGGCDQMEEIIGDDEEHHKEEGTDAIITFTLPKFRKLTLWGLPKLKSICSRRGVMVCDSLQQITVYRCSKLKRMPFSLPLLHNGQPSPPPSLQTIHVFPKEWWESVEWDHPNAKNVLLPFCKFRRWFWEKDKLFDEMFD